MPDSRSEIALVNPAADGGKISVRISVILDSGFIKSRTPVSESPGQFRGVGFGRPANGWPVSIKWGASGVGTSDRSCLDALRRPDAANSCNATPGPHSFVILMRIASMLLLAGRG